MEDLAPEGGSKLPPLVSHNDGRDSKTGDPTTEEGSGTGEGGDLSERDSLHPPGEPVDDREKVAHSF